MLGRFACACALAVQALGEGHLFPLYEDLLHLRAGVSREWAGPDGVELARESLVAFRRRHLGETTCARLTLGRTIWDPLGSVEESRSNDLGSVQIR